MLIRCDVYPGFEDLARAQVFGEFFKARGFRVAYAVRKEGHDAARRFLGDDNIIYRIPVSEDGEVERIGYLHRKHKHQILYVDRRNLSSSYLFQVRRFFASTVVLDRGSDFLIYGDIIINPAVGAPTHRYNCSSGAKLLLGPKFYFGANLATPSSLEQLFVLLKGGENWERIKTLLLAMADVADSLTVHVLCDPMGKVRSELGPFKEANPQFDVHPVIHSEDSLFPYDRYRLVLTQADEICLDLAAWGVPFATFAYRQDHLENAYALNQLGVAPTLGWAQAKKPEEMTDFFRQCILDEARRTGFVTHGQQLLDGQGLARIAHSLPREERMPRAEEPQED